MPVRVRVVISGLCLLVPDAAARAMHVLMPKTSGNAHGVEHHAARLLFDIGHLHPGQRLREVYAHVNMNQWGLELGPRPGTIVDPPFPAGITRLHKVTQKPIKRRLLDREPPADRLTSRVTFGAGSPGVVAPGRFWWLPPHTPECMSNAMEWVMPIPGPTLSLELLLLTNSGVTDPLPPLHPIDDEITLFLYHVVPDELPPLVAKPSQIPTPHHFLMYYDLFDGPASKVVPRHVGPCPSRKSNLLLPKSAIGGSAFTCMLALAPPE